MVKTFITALTMDKYYPVTYLPTPDSGIPSALYSRY